MLLNRAVIKFNMYSKVFLIFTLWDKNRKFLENGD